MPDGNALHRDRRRFLAGVGAVAFAGCTAPARPRESESDDGAGGDPDGGSDRVSAELGQNGNTEADAGDDPGEKTVVHERVDVDGTWPMFGVDAENTGFFEAGTADRSDPTLAWTSRVAGIYTLSQPVIDDDGVLYTASDLFAYALDVENGDRLWTSEVDYLSHHYPPAVDDGTLYVSTRTLEGQYSGGGSGALYAFDAADGSERWRVDGPFSSSPTVADETVYVSKNFRHESEVVALDPDSGDERWSRTIDEDVEQTNVFAAPAIRDDRLYVTVGTRGETGDDVGGAVLALDRADGSELWRESVGERVYASPILVDDAVVFAGEDGAVRAVDAEDGSERWEGDATEEVRTTPATDGEDVYLHVQDHVVKLDGGSGDREYKTPIGPTLINGIVVGEHSVYTGGTYVTSIEKGSGDVEWQYAIPAEFGGGFGAPTVLDGAVFVGACHKRENTSMYDDYVYALV